MWLIIFAAVIITAIGGLIYLAAGFHRFAVVKKIAEKNKAAAWAISFAAVAVIALPWLLFVNAWAMAVVLIHLFLFNLIFDALSLQKFAKESLIGIFPQRLQWFSRLRTSQ